MCICFEVCDPQCSPFYCYSCMGITGYGQRPSADDVVILMTDGESNINYWDTVPAASDLKAMGAKVVVVGISIQNDTEIKAIASTKEDVHRVRTFFS